jgi:hypothetical protein
MKANWLRGKHTGLLTAVLLAWLFTARARADGKVFPATAFPADVKIPDQSALLIWSNGVERLVIETRFTGEGTNFAWVVPVPSAPEIEPATTGLFPTLRTCLQPEVRHSMLNVWGAVLSACGLAWLLATVRPDEEDRGGDLNGCLATAIGIWIMMPGAGVFLGSLFLFLVLRAVVERVRRAPERRVGIVDALLVLLVFMFASLLLPALGVAGGGTAQPQGAVDILQRKVVGIFETTVISSKDPKALLQWLQVNGFAADKQSEPVIEQHAKDGWAFVAAKVHRDAVAAGPATPHPLSFTFKAAQPVYPLRLTATGSERLLLELFVVGPARAEIDGFKVAECHRLQRPAGGRFARNEPVGAIGHPLFANWAGALPVITKLTAQLSQEDMKQDATVRWRAFAEERSQVYSTLGAFLTTANWCGSPLCVLVVVAAFLAHLGRFTKAAAFKYASAGTALLILIGAVLFAALPKVEIRLEKRPKSRAEMELKRQGALAMSLMPTNQPPTVEAIRAVLRQASDGAFNNHLQGGLIHEEDSPGNYILRQTDEGVAFIGHDGTGTEAPMWVLPGPAAR